MLKLGVLVMAALQVACSLFGVQNEEGPAYEVILKNENLEIRKYSPYIVATTTVAGDFKESQSSGFRILAGYIFGANQSSQKIAMTSPVIQQTGPNPTTSEKIAMTSPVIQQATESGWSMSFMMPSKYHLNDLPKPTDSRIRLSEVPERLVAAIRFSGTWNESRNQDMAQKLESWLRELGTYDEISSPMFAGYNPPWTIPFFRRNEMMIEIRKK